MGLIDELIAINKAKAAGVEPGDADAPPRRLTQLEHRRRQRAKKRKGLDWALIEVTGKFARNQREARGISNRQRVLDRKQRQREAADRVVEERQNGRPGGRNVHRRGGDGKALFGTINAAAQWVGLIAAMQPGRWYGIRVLDQLAGRRKALYTGAGIATRMFVERGLNPSHRPERDAPGMVTRDVRRIGPIEPRYLWRLNRWGIALREAVLDDLTAFRIDVLALDGAASSDIWKSRGGRLKKKSKRVPRLWTEGLGDLGVPPNSRETKSKTPGRKRKFTGEEALKIWNNDR